MIVPARPPPSWQNVSDCCLRWKGKALLHWILVMGLIQCSLRGNSGVKYNSGCKYISKSSFLSNARWLFENCVLLSLFYGAEHCLVRHGSYQLKHTRATTFEITPLIPIFPIMETWHLVTRQKIVFKTPQRKTSVPDKGGKKKSNFWADREWSMQIHLGIVGCHNMFLHPWDAENVIGGLYLGALFH